MQVYNTVKSYEHLKDMGILPGTKSHHLPKVHLSNTSTVSSQGVFFLSFRTAKSFEKKVEQNGQQASVFCVLIIINTNLWNCY